MIPIVLLLVSLFAPLAAGAANSGSPPPEARPSPPDAVCIGLELKELSGLDPHLKGVFDFATGLDPKLVALERPPTWQDIEALKDAIAKLKAAEEGLRAQGRLA